MLFVGVASAQTGILTVDGQDYTILGAGVDVSCTPEYARGYNAGVAAGSVDTSSYSFTTTPVLRVDTFGDVHFSYVTNLPARANSDLLSPIIRITPHAVRSRQGEVVYSPPIFLQPFDVMSYSVVTERLDGLDTNPTSGDTHFDVLIMDSLGNIITIENLVIDNEL